MRFFAGDLRLFLAVAELVPVLLLLRVADFFVGLLDFAEVDFFRVVFLAVGFLVVLATEVPFDCTQAGRSIAVLLATEGLCCFLVTFPRLRSKGSLDVRGKKNRSGNRGKLTD